MSRALPSGLSGAIGLRWIAPTRWRRRRLSAPVGALDLSSFFSSRRGVLVRVSGHAFLSVNCSVGLSGPISLVLIQCRHPCIPGRFGFLVNRFNALLVAAFIFIIAGSSFMSGRMMRPVCPRMLSRPLSVARGSILLCSPPSPRTRLPGGAPFSSSSAARAAALPWRWRSSSTKA